MGFLAPRTAFSRFITLHRSNFIMLILSVLEEIVIAFPIFQ